MIEPIVDLVNRVKNLESKRSSQTEIPPNIIKMRHIGEGVRYIQTGLAADRPTTPDEPPNSTMVYFAYDTNVLSVWNISTDAWKTVTLT